MQPVSFHHLHVLSVDGRLGHAKLLRGILASLGIVDILTVENSEAANAALNADQYDAVFYDERVGPTNAVAFAMALRQDRGAKNRRVPIVLMLERPQLRHVELARDSGINDIMVRPLTVGGVKRKLLSVLEAPKPFVNADGFAGPDRRRKDRRDRAADRSGTANDDITPAFERRKRGVRRRRTDQPDVSATTL